MRHRSISAAPVRHHTVITLLAAVLVIPLVLLVSSGQAAAAIACDSGMLRTAIDEANDNPGPDTIELSAGCVYSYLDVPVDRRYYWYGPSALPAIASDITIVGNGATIERAAAATLPFRLFYVAPDPADPKTLDYHGPAQGPDAPAAAGAGKLTLTDLTLRGGFMEGGYSDWAGGGAGLGGAIFNQGDLVLDGVTLTGNEARGGRVTGELTTPTNDGAHATIRGGGGLGSPILGEPSNNQTQVAGSFVPDARSYLDFGGAAGGLDGTNANADSLNGGGSGGGGGFRATDNGEDGEPTVGPGGEFTDYVGLGGAGGGPRSGLGGDGGTFTQKTGDHFAPSGNGSGGGGLNLNGAPNGYGGDFGRRPVFGGSHVSFEVGGGGGVGVGGSGGRVGTGGGGGFGGGGGGGIGGGHGGFGGGGGSAEDPFGDHGTGGFGGGSGWFGGPGAGMGGAIFNMQGDVEIRDSTLTANTATAGLALGLSLEYQAVAAKGLGGAIFNLSGVVLIDDSTLTGNEADDGGGAVYDLGYDAATERHGVVDIDASVLSSSNGGVPDLVSDASAQVDGSREPPLNLSHATATVSIDSTVQGYAEEGTGVVIFEKPANTAPVAVADARSVTAGEALTVNAPGVLGNDTDADGDPLFAALGTGPAHGTLDLHANGGFTYTADTGFSGTDTFTYRASDPNAGPLLAAGAVSPAAVSDVSTVTLTVTRTDPGGDPGGAHTTKSLLPDTGAEQTSGLVAIALLLLGAGLVVLRRRSLPRRRGAHLP